MHVVLERILLCELDEIVSDPAAHTARPAMQHDPDIAVFVETHFDKVVACPERSKMTHVVALGDRWVLFTDAPKHPLHSEPGAANIGWCIGPCSTVVRATIIRATVRHRRFDCGAGLG